MPGFSIAYQIYEPKTGFYILLYAFDTFWLADLKRMNRNYDQKAQFCSRNRSVPCITSSFDLYNI